jgi:uncharacterized membrane protein
LRNGKPRWALALRHQWHLVRASFWFAPALIVTGAVGLAAAAIAVDSLVELRFVERSPLLFGAGAEGARGLLSAVASSMITVAGVVFSITIVALSLTSSQYTSRVLRNFMRDRVNQVVLGVFVGIFAYCLVVLRTIRGGDEGGFVPSLAVMIGLLMGLVGIAFLVYFIHHIAVSIQAPSVIAAAAHETLSAIDRLYPKKVGEQVNAASNNERSSPEQDFQWRSAPSLATGYIESVDFETLRELAEKWKVKIRMERGLGEFAFEGAPLLSVADSSLGDELSEERIGELNSVCVFSRERTLQQDVGYGVRQIVDIALRALSPGVNDTTTATMCVDYLAAIFARLATREMSIYSPKRFSPEEEEPRLFVREPTFDDLFSGAFDQIRQNAAGNVAALGHLLTALEMIARAASDDRRKAILAEQRRRIVVTAEGSAPAHDLASLRIAADKLKQCLEDDKEE